MDGEPPQVVLQQVEAQQQQQKAVSKASPYASEELRPGGELRSAHAFANVVGLPPNAFVTAAPFRCGGWDGASSPADEFAAFRNWLGVWVRRSAKVKFTSVSVVHAKPDGTDAHLHSLLHLARRPSSLT